MMVRDTSFKNVCFHKTRFEIYKQNERGAYSGASSTPPPPETPHLQSSHHKVVLTWEPTPKLNFCIIPWLFLKVSQKNSLCPISRFMSLENRRKLMKAFIESQFNYCPLTWMLHSRTLNSKINRIHERALRTVYSDCNSSFNELLDTDGSFTIHQRNV